LRRGRIVLLHFLQKALNALHVFLRKIQNEVQLRHAAELQPFDQFPPDVPGSVFERFDRVGLLLVRSFDTDEYSRVLMSGWTRTSLATTLTSSRGSFNSPASMALISWAISSPTRSCR